MAAAVRLYRLDHFSYGLDEVIQAFWLRGDWSYFWETRLFDVVHPPLDYLVGRLLEQAQPADWARKLPAVAWGVGTVAALGALLARRAGRSVGLVGAALLALAPFHVRFSQELRPYSLGLFLLCLSLLALDRYLERPAWTRLLALYFAGLGTAYSLYLAALVLGIAALALLVEDAASGDTLRRSHARRFLRWSPLFLAALVAGYLPWLPVLMRASQSPSPEPPPPLVLERLGRSFSFFGFAPADGHPLGWGGLLFIGLVVAGLVLALRTRRMRFLAVWALLGAATIEALEQIHPHYYVSRHFLPVGIALVGLAALPAAHLFSVPRRRAAGVALLASVLLLDVRGLAGYFREGRADWRPLASFLRERPDDEPIFTGSQYTQLCTAFYVAGPEWLYRESRGFRPIWSLQGEARRLTWSWKPGTTGWLVISWNDGDTPLAAWAKMFPATSYPTAEGAILYRLDPALWERMRETAR